MFHKPTDTHPIGHVLIHPTDPTRGVQRGPNGWSSVTLRDGRVVGGLDNLMPEPPANYKEMK